MCCWEYQDFDPHIVSGGGRAALHAPPRKHQHMKAFCLTLSHQLRYQTWIASFRTLIRQSIKTFHCLNRSTCSSAVRFGISYQKIRISSHHSSQDSSETSSSISIDQESLPDSPLQNLLQPFRPPLTHLVPTDIPALPSSSSLQDDADPWIRALLLHGASLPPPAGAPHIFQRTPPSPLMDEVIHHLESQGILREQQISTAYRCFLVSKSDLSARFINY